MLWSWLVLSAAVFVAQLVVPGFQVKPGWGIVKVAAIFGLLHWALGWLIFFLIGVGTLGIGFLLAFITRWIVSAIVLKIADSVSDSLHIRSFGTALVAALVMSGVGTVAEWVVRR